MPALIDGSNSNPHAHPSLAVVFSLHDGFVWASWPGTEASVKLGRCEPVTAMMQDFLDQCALGERLARKADE